MDMVTTNTKEGDFRLNKENVLRDFVRFSWRVTRGLAESAEIEAKEVVKKMVEAGRLSPQEGDRLYKTLNSRMNEGREAFEQRVDTGIRRTLEKLTALSNKELTRLTHQVQELEKRLERATKR